MHRCGCQGSITKGRGEIILLQQLLDLSVTVDCVGCVLTKPCINEQFRLP